MRSPLLPSPAFLRRPAMAAEWAARAATALLAIASVVPMKAIDQANATFDVGDLRNEGEQCFHLRHRRAGTCVYMNACPTVYEEADRLIFPQICGWSRGRGLVPNVCCVSVRPPPGAYPTTTTSPPYSPSYPTSTTSPPYSPIYYPTTTSPPDTTSAPYRPSYPTPTSPPYTTSPTYRPSYPTSQTTTTPRPPHPSYPVPGAYPQQDDSHSSSEAGLSPWPSPSEGENLDAHFGDMHLGEEHPEEMHPEDMHPEDMHPFDMNPDEMHPDDMHPDDMHFEDSEGQSGEILAQGQDGQDLAQRRPSQQETPGTSTERTTTTRRPEDDGAIEFPEDEPLQPDLPDRIQSTRPKSTTTTTRRPTTTTTRKPTTTTRKPTTTTRKPTTTTRKPTTTTRKPTTTTSRPTTTTARVPDTVNRKPPMASGGGNALKCYAGESTTASGYRVPTAAISLRRGQSGFTNEGDVDVLPGEPAATVAPSPDFASCSSDDSCTEWTTNRWRRERRVAGDGYPLAVDEQVRVRLSTVRAGQLLVGLCTEPDAEDAACAVVVAVGTATDGLRFETRITTSGDIADPAARVVAQAPSGGTTPLPSGRKYTLVLHRRSGDKLDVWLDGRPVNKASVDLGAGMSYLRASSPAGTIAFVQGQEVDGYHMEVGERVIVRLNVTRDGLLDLGLCGDRACSVVRVTGADDQGAFGYSTRITSSNSVTEERGQALMQPSGPDAFPLGSSLSFVVSRKSEWAMDVWLEGDPEQKATVPLEPDRLRLKVDSDAGLTSFVRGTAADGFIMQPGKRVIVEVGVESATGVLDIGLCGAAACATVRVRGADDRAGLGYSVRTTATNSVSDEDADETEGSELKGFTTGRSLRLVVQHAPAAAAGRAAQLRIWLDGDEERAAVVDLGPAQGQRPRLKLASSVGPATLVQVLTEGRELAVGERATLVLTVTKEDGWLWLGLCSEDACSAMGVIGAGDDNRFSFTSRITTSNSVIGDGPVWQSSTRGPRKFTAGQTLRFVVHRRTAGLMDVWLEPASSRKTTIPLEEDRVVLKAATDAGSVVYEDGGAAGYQLSVSEQVRVEVRPARPQGWVFVGLCGAASCTVLGVGGATGGKLSTATRVSAAGSVLAPGPVVEESPGPDTFEVDSPLTLILHRMSERLLSVRLEGLEGLQGDAGGSSSADLQVPLEPDHDRLDVVSAVGSTRLLSGVAVDGHLMSVDERLRVLFRASRPDGWLSVGLCDETACSVVRVSSLRPWAYTTRITRGTSVGSLEGEVLEEVQPDGAAASSFVVGRNYTLWVHRVSTSALDVWADGDPGAKVSVPLGPDRTVFKVDSTAGSTFLDTRGAADGWPLAIGDQLWISLEADAAQGRLYLGMCGDTSCSVARVRGVEDNKMGYSTAILDTNSVSGRGDDLTEQTGPLGFTPGNKHVFVVRRSPGGLLGEVLEAWLEDDPDNKAVVRLSPGDTRFKVTSTAGPTTFVRGREWVSEDESSALVGPTLPPVRAGTKVCLDLEYLSTRTDQPLTLGANGILGNATIGTLPLDRVASWRRRTVLTPVPEQQDGWTLELRAARGVRLRRLARCMLDGSSTVVLATPAGGSRRRRRNRWQRATGRRGGGQRRAHRQTEACDNGGYRNASSAACVCPPGYTGDSCEAGCSGDTFGPACEFRCPDETLGCFGTVLCVPGHYCACAPGLGGDRCDRVCQPGDADCSLPCDAP